MHSRRSFLNVGVLGGEYIVSRRTVIPVPGELSDRRRAAVVNPITAWMMTIVEHDLKPGDWCQTAAPGHSWSTCAATRSFGTLPARSYRAAGTRPGSVHQSRVGEVVITSEDKDGGTQRATASEGKALSRAIACVAGRPSDGFRAPRLGGRMLV